MLDGMFSFVLLDESVTPSRVIAARDPIGITTLYQGYNSKSPETIFFASELKAINEECDVINAFPPGHFWDSRTNSFERYFKPTWWNGDSGKPEDIPHNPVDYTLLRETLERAVRKRLMAEVPYGVLLSGGLDSSLIAAIAARETEKVAKAQMQRREERIKAQENGGSGYKTPEWTGGTYSCYRSGICADLVVASEAALTAWPQLHSFAVGLPGAPDLLAARKAADYLGTTHHEFTFTLEEGE